MNWTDVPTLVTGAGGFIGSHLVEALAAQGARVRAFVRYNSRGDVGRLAFLPKDLLEKLEIIRGDLRDSSAVTEAMDDCESVFHLGALIAIPYSYLHPREVVDTNVIGTLNVLEAARRTNPKRLVHVSTSEVYGTALSVPINEDHPLQGQSPYSASKIGADSVAESYRRSFNLPIVTVRPFNTYGPRQSARAVIPTIVTQALTGDRIYLGSQEPTRDFTYVTDVVRAFMSAAQAGGAVGRVINVGSNEEISVGDLGRKVLQLLGREARIITDGARVRPTASEVERLRADNALARRLLGWQPSISLEDGLKQTIAWIEGHLDLYRVGEYEV